MFSAAQVHAYQTLRDHYQAFFADPTTENGLRPSAIADPEQIRQLTSFFTWSAWASAAQRPGQTYSYTNNWPPEPLVGNQPTADSLVWSVLSLIALLGGIGLLFAAFGRWDVLGWRGRERQALRFFLPGRGGADASPAHDRLVLPGHGGTLPGADPARCRVAALSSRPVRVLWSRSGALVPVQPHPHLARPVVDLLGGDGFPGGRHLPRADDRRP